MMTPSQALPAGWPDLFAPDAPRVGLGLDLGTTAKGKSNPSALVCVQQVGSFYYARLVARWKTAAPAVTRAMLRHVIQGLPHGYRPRRLCIDATSERFFAADLRREFAPLVRVVLVINSEATEYRGERMIFKVYLGNLLVNTFEDGRLALPADRWVHDDIRQVVRDRGTFDAPVAEDGAHADVFAALQLALHALVAKGGPVEASGMSRGVYGGGAGAGDRFPLRPDHSEDRRHAATLTMP